jgi:hypothetical protein
LEFPKVCVGTNDVGGVGRVCRSDGARSLLGTVSIIRSFLRNYGCARPYHGLGRTGTEKVRRPTTKNAGKMPAVPGAVPRPGKKCNDGGPGVDGMLLEFPKACVGTEFLGWGWKSTSLRWSSVSFGDGFYNQVAPSGATGARGRTTAGQEKGMPARCRRSQGGRDVIGVSEGVRGDGGGAVWEGRVCRSAGARSLLGVRCYNQVVPTELRVRDVE